MPLCLITCGSFPLLGQGKPRLHSDGDEEVIAIKASRAGGRDKMKGNMDRKDKYARGNDGVGWERTEVKLKIH